LNRPTVRRSLSILLFLGFLLGPAPAQAEAPADATAFADAAAQLRTDVDQAGKKLGRLFRGPGPACARMARRPPVRAERDLALLETWYMLRRFGRELAPALETFSLRLHAVQTDDMALRAGRTAWRRIKRFYTERIQHTTHLCQALRGFVHSGYRTTPAVREARRVMTEFERLDRDGSRRLRAARERLEALGIPHERAVAFEG
jgi:hypothetical protein